MTESTPPFAHALEDRYRFEGMLGRGGMATVYLAHDLRYGRQVAFKILRPDLALMLGRERFLREIQLTALLQHPHVLPVFDSGETDGQLWFTMPYAEGDSLRARLDRERQLPIETALRVAREVADALEYAHARGVVHRDIKPENILFSGDHALVADFGIARAIDTLESRRLTETGTGVGTPQYMSPEQSMGEKDVDGRSDLYALASVLYEMLAGEPPFIGANAQAIIAKRLSQAVPSVRTLRETVPASVDRAISIALAKAPADRFGSTREFAAALAAEPSDTVSVPLHARSPRPHLRHLVMAAAVAVVGIATGWTMLRANAIPVAATVVAVFPFAPTTSDTALTRLGRDLAGTVSASLDGIGEIRTIDRLTVLAQTPEGSEALPLSAAAALGQRLGASSVVHGSLSREGSLVRLDVGLFTSDSLRPLGRGTVLAAPDSLSALTDSVVWRLLAEIWRYGRAPTPTIEAVTTRSVDALRAYLDGERMLVAGDGEQAKAAYGRAIASDSTFWFAYFRYGHPMGWHEEPDSATKAAYWNHRHLLPERERLLVEASQLDSGLVWQWRRLEELVQRYPDYSPGWWLLGDQLLHVFPHVGATPMEARDAFERVVTLTPGMVGGWEHLAWAAAGLGDTGTIVRAVDALERLGAGPLFLKTEGLDKLLLYRTQLALTRQDGSAGRMLDSFYLSAAPLDRDHFVPSVALTGVDPAAQIAFNRRLLARGLPPDEARITTTFIAFAWAVRGAWDSALVVRDGLVRGPTDTLALLTAYRTAVLGAWVGALPVDDAERRRPAMAPLIEACGPGFRAELAWLDGVLAVAGHDLNGLTAARVALKRSGGAWTSYLDRSLGAFQLALEGDRRSAASAMAALEWELADGTPHFVSRATPHALLRGVDRLAAAEWLQEAGRGAEALPLLRWHRTFPNFEDKIPLAPLAFLFSARIEATLGDTAAARRDYALFLKSYDMPTPNSRHLVAEARDALERLTGSTTPVRDH